MPLRQPSRVQISRSSRPSSSSQSVPRRRTSSQSQHRRVSEARVVKHDPDRPYTCDTCDYITKRKATLIDHLTTHQAHRTRYSCPEQDCDRDFGRQADLNRHTKAVSLVTKLVQDDSRLISVYSTMAPMAPTPFLAELVGGILHEVTRGDGNDHDQPFNLWNNHPDNIYRHARTSSACRLMQ